MNYYEIFSVKRFRMSNTLFFCYFSSFSPLFTVLKNEVSNVGSWQFGYVGPFMVPNGPDDDINTKNCKNNFGFNETVQKVLASIV